MSARLAPALLDAARAPLDRIIVRDWILQGLQKLDGLLCIKSHAPDGWAAQILPWLDAAASVLESDDYVLLRFAAPVEIDCAVLGPLMPVQHRDGVLATAGVEFPASQLQTALADNLLIVLHGERTALPLKVFRRVDIAGIWDLRSVSAARTTSLPLVEISTRPAPELKTVAPIPFEAADLAAGFKALKDRLDAAPEPKWKSGLFAPGGWLNRIGRLIVALTIPALAIFFACLLWQMDWSAPLTTPARPSPPPRSGGDQDWLSLVAILAIIVLIYAISAGMRATPPPATGASAPARPGWIRRIFTHIVQRLKRPPPALGGGGAAPAGAETAPAEPKPPGMLRKLWGWLVWNTPLSRDLERKWALRLQEVDRLFREGRIEEALKRALALAGDTDADALRKLLDLYGDMPLTGPSIREKLELDLSGASKQNEGSLSADGYRHFTDLYHEQAKALIAAGDIESAVFIYAELLNDARAAVDLLVSDKRYETAARLAQARRLPPGLFIPLWFKAGDKRRALALAARHNAFGELLKEAAQDDPFRAEIGTAWARRLASTGHFERALALTAEYPQGIGEERRDWLKQACAEEPHGEPLARALAVLPWQPGEHGGPHADFTALLEAGPQLAHERIVLARLLADKSFEAASTHPDFARKLPLLAHCLARRLAADEAALGHDSARAEAARELCERGGQFALRTDLRRLAKVPKPQKAVPRTFLELAPAPHLAAIVDAAPLPGERLMVLYRSGLAKLMRFDGKVLWQEQLNGVRDIVPIGDGALVFVIRDELGERRLSLFDTRTRKHRELGLFPVEFYHRWAGADGWLVFANGGMVSLDVPSLLKRADDPEAEIDRHWSIPMGEEGWPLFFIDKPGEVHFAYQRADGLTEWWWLDRKTLRVSCRYWINPPHRGEGSDMTGSVFGAAATGETGPLSVWTSEPSCTAINRIVMTREQELTLRNRVLEDGFPLLLYVEPMASPHAPKWWAQRTENGVEWVSSLAPPAPDFRILFHGAEHIHASPHPDTRTIAVFDDLGRLVVIDLNDKRILVQMT